jgi:biopolymer transport protein ExbB
MCKTHTRRAQISVRSSLRSQVLVAVAACVLSFSVHAQTTSAGGDGRPTNTVPSASVPANPPPADATTAAKTEATPNAPTASPSQTDPASGSASSSPSPRSATSTDGTVLISPLPDALSPLSMFLQADVVVKAVMIGLALASVATWTVLLVKMIQLRTARREVRGALAGLLTARSLMDAVRQTEHGQSTIGRLLAVADDEIDKSRGLAPDGVKERVAWQFERIEAAAVHRIGRGMGILATIGAVAPFVGLFGTVWGIMNSFIGISQAHTTNLAVVAPGIAEALLATAFGLVAAIPAVVIYNAFARATGSYRAVLADSSVAILRLLSRDLDRQAQLIETRRPLRAADAPALSIANPAE